MPFHRLNCPAAVVESGQTKLLVTVPMMLKRKFAKHCENAASNRLSQNETPIMVVAWENIVVWLRECFLGYSIFADYEFDTKNVMIYILPS
jgi:hypothetical protein